MHMHVCVCVCVRYKLMCKEVSYVYMPLDPKIIGTLGASHFRRGLFAGPRIPLPAGRWRQLRKTSCEMIQFDQISKPIPSMYGIFTYILVDMYGKCR